MTTPFTMTSLALALLAAGAVQAQPLHRPTQDLETDRYIVVLKATPESKAKGSAARQLQVSQFSQQHRLQVHQQLPAIGALSVSLSQRQLQKLRKDPAVEYVEVDPKRYLMAESVPYGITMVKALQVSDQQVSNRKVCIIDTGYTLSHPDLINSGVTGDDGYGSNDTGNWYQDGNGHGTHVAGTISAVGGNNQGVVGVNRNGQLGLHIVKVFNDSGNWAYGSDLIAAIDQCQKAGANVTSMSLGGSGSSQAEQAAFDASYAQGMLHIAAAGNAGNSTKSFPASYNAVVSVAAVDSNEAKASFSQYNDQVEIAAPGVGVQSTYKDGGYKSLSGTSMATPHVSGVAALVWSHYPQCSASQIRNALNKTARDKGAVGRDTQFGFGIIDAKAAYDYLANGCEGGPIDTNQAPVAKFSVSISGRTVTFNNQSTDDKAVVSQQWSFGDGSTSTVVNPVNTYAADGEYTVQLTVKDEAGLTGSVSQKVQVGEVKACQGLTEWQASKTYVRGNSVSYQGVKYTAKWWTLGENPANNSGQWDVWKKEGACQ